MKKRKNKRYLRNIYRRFLSNYFIELERAVGDSKTLIDVGCGNSSPIQHFSKKIKSVGIDAFDPSIKQSKEQGIHDKYYKMNFFDIDKKFKKNSFDCVLSSDTIEHLEKEDGLKLLKKMEAMAKEKVIVFTPNGFMPQGEFNKNPWQVHRSGWTPEEMKKMGYKVIGVYGWKKLRGEFHLIKYKPMYFWWVLSDLTHLFTKRNPSKAAAILCVKDMSSNK